MFVDFEGFDGTVADPRPVPLHLQGPDVADDDAPQIDFGGMDVPVDHGPFGHDDVAFGFDVAFDFTVDVDAADAVDVALYGRAGGDDGGRAWAAICPVSAIRDSHGTCFTFLKMVR